MTEDEFEREKRDEAAMDPNAVIDVKELAHRRWGEIELPSHTSESLLPIHGIIPACNGLYMLACSCRPSNAACSSC